METLILEKAVMPLKEVPLKKNTGVKIIQSYNLFFYIYIFLSIRFFQ